MVLTSQNWPIGAALLQFPGTLPDGSRVQDADPKVWDEVFREVRLAGFDHIDLTDSWVEPGNLGPERLGLFKEGLDTAGLGVSAISTVRKSIIDPDDEIGRANFEYTKRNVAAAAALGTSVLCVGFHAPLHPDQQTAHWFWLAPGHVDPVDDPARWQLAVDRLREICDLASESDIQVSLEMYEDTYLGTSDSCIAIVKDVDRPNLGINPDIGNIVRLHREIEPWEDMVRKLAPYTNYWHMKNYFRDHDPATGAYFSSPAPMEAGFINYRRAIQIALEAGFDGPICVEHYGGDGLSVAAANREYIRRILAVQLGES